MITSRGPWAHNLVTAKQSTNARPFSRIRRRWATLAARDELQLVLINYDPYVHMKSRMKPHNHRTCRCEHSAGGISRYIQASRRNPVSRRPIQPTGDKRKSQKGETKIGTK